MNSAFKSAEILLPKKEYDYQKWAVVACDQYTSEPAYWNAVEKLVGAEPSTYRLILPEVYLNQPDVDSRLSTIESTMSDYLEKGVFDIYSDAMIYVERTDSNGKVRRGLVGALDLEQYDYHKGSTSLVRATEATVASRIPPRMKIRQNAPIELPHIMVLIDDPEKTVIEPLSKGRKDTPLYDFELMQGGGRLRGYLIQKEEQEKIQKALEKLSSRSLFNGKYGLKDEPVLLFAMGDGNHSLATAKECYEKLKLENPGQDFTNHPARYALVELVNLHSDALEFEAIHRIVTGVRADELLGEMKQKLLLEKIDAPEDGTQCFVSVVKGQKNRWKMNKISSKLSVGTLQNFLDEYLMNHKECSIDYIHGKDVVLNLSMQENSIGFLLPDMSKSELFPTVITDGALPRKTFSMGHAQDKRFYMECRKIRE